MPKEITTIYIDGTLLKEARIRCAKNDIHSVSSLINQLFTILFDNHTNGVEKWECLQKLLNLR